VLTRFRGLAQLRGQCPDADVLGAQRPPGQQGTARRAKERLEALRLVDMTQISRLRIGSQGWLYGVRTDNVFHVVWWDPQHEMWPSHTKHT